MSLERKKRQRIPLNCANCRQRKIKCDRNRPTCGRCFKTGVLCEYSTRINGVNSVNNLNGVNSTSYIYSANGPSPTNIKGNNGITQEQIQLPEENEADYLIDFYDYNSLVIKSKVEEDHKPLELITLSIKDPYMLLFSCYMVFTLKLNSGTASNQQSNPNYVSKWMGLIDTTGLDSDLVKDIERVHNDRKLLVKSPYSSYFLNLDGLISQLEKRLPTTDVIDIYLKYFFDKLWLVRQWIDEQTFRNEIKSIMVLDPITQKQKILKSDPRSLSKIAILLIILRYSNIALQLSTPSSSTLIDHPIPVSFIDLAHKIIQPQFRKPTLDMIVALLYLRVYYRDSPEFGDSIRLTQSQYIMGLIVQSSLSIGLNVDPESHRQLKNDKIQTNLRRKIWFSIVEIDARSCILAGCLTTLPDKRFVSVKIPELMTDSISDQYYRDEIIKDIELNEIFYNISQEVNDLEPTSLTKLLGLIELLDDYIRINYNMESMIPLKHLTEGTNYYQAVNFRNMKILMKNLLQISLKMNLLASVCSHFEDNLHLNREMYQKMFLKLMTVVQVSSDISMSYLSNRFNDFIGDYNFELLPLVGVCGMKSFSTHITVLLRLYNSNELNPSNPYIGEMIKLLYDPLETFIIISRDNICRKYYSGLKMFVLYRYSYSVLKDYEFESMRLVINFFNNYSHIMSETNNNKLKRIDHFFKLMSSYVKNLSKDWVTSHSGMVNVKKTNFFTNVDLRFILDCLQLLKKPYKYMELMEVTGPQRINNKNISRIIKDAFSTLNEKPVQGNIATGTETSLLDIFPADFDATFASFLDELDFDINIFEDVTKLL